jgi:hypothetical protein
VGGLSREIVVTRAVWAKGQPTTDNRGQGTSGTTRVYVAFEFNRVNHRVLENESAIDVEARRERGARK